MPLRERIYYNIAFDLTSNWLIMRMEWELKRNKLPIAPIADTCLTTDDLSDDTAYKIAASFLQQAEKQGAMSSNPPSVIHIQWKSFEVDVLNLGSYLSDVLCESEYNFPHSDTDIQELLSSCREKAGTGGLPEHLRGLLDESLRGRKLPWHILFKRYLEEAKGDESDFLPPDKRMLYNGMILPYNNEDIMALDNALIVLDVSSSVEKGELMAQVWQICSILNELKFNGSIIAFAGDVHQKAFLTDKPSLKKFIDELAVGGGTDWEKVVEYVNRQIPVPKPIVVFTNGYFFSFAEGLSNVIFITQNEPPSGLKKLGKIIKVK